jgi:hypothetical protein
MDGELIAFVTSSAGGRIAVEELCRKAANNKKAGRDYTPKIRLAIGTFKSKAHGEHECPKFEFVDAAPVEISEVKKNPAEASRPDEVKKKPKADFDDAIPF